VWCTFFAAQVVLNELLQHTKWRVKPHVLVREISFKEVVGRGVILVRYKRIRTIVRTAAVNRELILQLPLNGFKLSTGKHAIIVSFNTQFTPWFIVILIIVRLLRLLWVRSVTLRSGRANGSRGLCADPQECC
jgi:hypothetical protein